MTTELTTIDTSTELTLLPPARTPAAAAVEMLRGHAEMMGMAFDLADKIVRTQLVPMRYRGKAEDATAAILYGAELGLNPIQSLQRVISIHGMPSLESRTMVALLKSRGYQIKTTAKSDTSATVVGFDLDGERYESTWTIERATRAGYVPRPSSDSSQQRPDVDDDWVCTTKTFDGRTKKSVVGNMKYITDPQTMLTAKAQAEVCREMAPDVLLGMPYSREDLESESFDDEPRARRPRSVSVQRVDAVVVDEAPGFASLIKQAPAVDPVEVDESDPVPEPLAEPESEPADEPTPAPAPAPAAKTNGETTREKWMTRLIELLGEAKIDTAADRLLVVAKAAKIADLLNYDALSDKHLRAAVNTLAAWSKAGELGNQVTDILNASFLAEMNTDGAESAE